MLGQLLGDFAINSVLEGKHDRLHAGVRAHRALDQFTDTHPAFIKAVKLLENGCGRYAPVVMDVYLDRVLVQYWPEFCHPLGFVEFLERMYGALERLEPELPTRMKTPATRMRKMDWFSGFAETQALKRVFYFMAKRVRKPEWIEHAAVTIEGQRARIEPLALEILRDPGLIKFGSKLF